jgi:hypothetical protein
LALCSAFVFGRTTIKPEVVEKVISKVVEVEAKTKQKITKIVKKPSGETETVIVENEVVKIEKVKETVSAKTSEKRKWRVGAGVVVDPADLKKYEYVASVGYRALDHVWVEGAYNFGKKEVVVGVSVEI